MPTPRRSPRLWDTKLLSCSTWIASCLGDLTRWACTRSCNWPIPDQSQPYPIAGIVRDCFGIAGIALGLGSFPGVCGSGHRQALGSMRIGCMQAQVDHMARTALRCTASTTVVHASCTSFGACTQRRDVGTQRARMELAPRPCNAPGCPILLPPSCCPILLTKPTKLGMEAGCWWAP
jgi:hypothetical protein